MVPLYRTVPLPQINGISGLVSQNLELDMMRIHNQLLQIHIIIAKGCLRLRFGCPVSIFQFFFGKSLAHSFSSASGAGFDQHRITDFLCQGFRLFFALQQFRGAGHYRHPMLHHQFSRRLLIPHPGDDVCGRTDEGNVVLLAFSDKFSVF